MLDIEQINDDLKSKMGRELMVMVRFSDVLGLMAGDQEAIRRVYSQLYRLAVSLGYFDDPASPKQE